MPGEKAPPSFYQRQQIDCSFRNAFQHWREAMYWGDPAKIAAAEQEFARAKQARDAATVARDKAALGVLTPARKKRMVQISLRYVGIRALARPEIAEQAGLTSEQVAEFQAVLAARERKIELQTVEMMRDPVVGKSVEKRNRLLTKLIEAKTKGQQPVKEDNEEYIRLLKEEFRHRQIEDAERDRFERAVDAKLSRVLTRYQRGRFAKMLGPGFDLRRLEQHRPPQAVPKAESKPEAEDEDAKNESSIEK